jgi:hypothetical protein
MKSEKYMTLVLPRKAVLRILLPERATADQTHRSTCRVRFSPLVRYPGRWLAFNTFAGILSAALTLQFATWLAKNYDLRYVSYYLSASAVLTFIGLLLFPEAKENDLVRN